MSRRSHIRSASSDDALRGISNVPPSSFGSENSAVVAQTPWRKISNGISQAWKSRKTRVGLGDKTNLQRLDPADVAQRFSDIVENPTHLRLMKKSQLQSAAVIVNEALPESRRIDPWTQDKEKLRNAIEDVFGFPRTISPRAPRRSGANSENTTSRFNSLSENYPPASTVTTMLLATPASKASKPSNSVARKPKRHSIDGLPSRGLSDSDFLFGGGSLGTTGKTKGSSGSMIPVSTKKKKGQATLRTIFSQPNTSISSNAHRSPNRPIPSSSPSKTYSESSSPPSSPLASRSTHGSLNILSPVLSRSNSASGIPASASLGGGLVSASSSGAALSSWGRHSRQGSGKDSISSQQHILVAEDLTMALLASRVESHGCVSASSSTSSVGGAFQQQAQQGGGMTASRTRSRMSWVGTTRFLDVVAEEEEEGEGNNGSVEGGEEEGADRPRKRRREECSASSSGFRTRRMRGFALTSMHSGDLSAH